MNRRAGFDETAAKPQRSSRLGKSSPFVGRDEEMRRLATALTLAAEAEGSTIFITGQPGIGKTRLAREALALAKAHGFTVLEGRAFPLQAGLAYAPFIDAFGPLLRGFDSAHVESLVNGLPSLGRIFEGLPVPVPSFSEGVGDPAVEKTRLFEAVSRLLERLTREAPVAFLVDDLDRADTASLELLAYIIRGIPDQRVLLLATYCSDAAAALSSLRTLTVEMKRSGLAQEIAVARLGSDLVDKLAGGILGGEAPSELLALLDARAAGTPLFVETLITGLIDSGHLLRKGSSWVLDAERAMALPSNVRHLILERLGRLAPLDRRVLDLIAIMGDATSHAVLRAASSLAEEILIESLHRLRATGWVAERRDGPDVVYSIMHPLIQEVAYAELPEMARRRAHVAAIEVLESFSEGRPEDVNRLAPHYHGAGPEADPDRALAVLLAAGEQARAVYANEEAARHYVAALAMVRQGRGLRVERIPPQPSTLPELLERLGEVRERMGETRAAVESWSEALAERERAGNVVAASRLRHHLAVAEWDRGRFEIADAHLQAGLAALAGREPCQELVDLLHERLHNFNRLGDLAALKDTVAELLSVAERLGSPRAEAQASLAAYGSYLWQNDVSTARERALHALMLGESALGGQDLAICCRAHSALVVIGMRLGDHQFMRYHSERGLAVAQRLGAPYWEAVLRVGLAVASFMSGAWEQSLRHSMEAIGLARRLGHPRDLAYSLGGRALLLALQGDLPQAEVCISEVRMDFGRGLTVDRHVLGLIEMAETAVALERGQVERALGAAMGFISSSQSGLPGRAPSGQMPPSWPIGLMLLAEAQTAAGDPGGALETASRIVELGPSGTPYLTALASRAEGLARHALGQREAAVACLTRAHETFVALEMPFDAARTLLEQAVSAPGGVRSDAAVTAAQQALKIFEGLGARRYADRARHLLRELGISTRRPRQSLHNGTFLSERQLAIARLVTAGLTTPEIGHRLFLSERTVTTHLTNIYARLGVRSRAALSRYVTEAGLLSPVENT